VLMNLIGFWRSFVCVGNTGGAGVVSSRFLRWLGLGGKSFLWWVLKDRYGEPERGECGSR
jgi:hypothetical protein